MTDKYQPFILWNDIVYPSEANLAELFAYYYNNVEDGVINDCFTQVRNLPSSTPSEK